MWIKKGLIYEPSMSRQAWSVRNATLPVPYLMDEERLRIYIGMGNADNVSRIGYVDVSPENPGKILEISETPVLDTGLPGTFDDNGVVPICLVEDDGVLKLYYVGFQLGVQVRYYLFAGLAVSEDGGQSFRRVKQTPVLDRSDAELFVRTAPFVMKEDGVWKMWYLAGSEWCDYHGKSLPVYKVKYAESKDGIHWPEEGRLCIDTTEDIHGFGRPHVVRGTDGYRMFLSARYLSKGYRLAVAHSPDGKSGWTMDADEMGMELSEKGWDSEMQCFGVPFSCQGKTYLFYNGNDYGQSGFGYAELERQEG